MTKQSKFAKSYAFELMKIASQDLESAEFLANQAGVRVENVFLLAQQALEKSLKAVLCWADQPIPFLHDIGVLVAKLDGLGLSPPFGFDLNSLSEYATIRGYLEGKEAWAAEEVKAVLSQVRAACAWCLAQIPEPGKDSDGI